MNEQPSANSPPGEPGAANLVLLGYRGAGKTTVGQRVAARLGWSFVDTDQRIEATTGRSIREIFEHDGEAAFRRTEAAVIQQVLRGRKQVISVGGGAVLSPANRQALRAAALCVWLTAPAEELHRRILGDPRSGVSRPPLTEGPALQEVRRLLAQREPLYAATAHHVVQTAGRSVEQVVDAVLKALTGRDGSAETS